MDAFSRYASSAQISNPLNANLMNRLILFIFGLSLVACSNDSDPEADKANFTRIYNSDQYNTSYNPIDMKQTPDGGYLVLAGRRLEESNFSGIYLMKLDEFGGFVSEQLVDEEYVNPVGELLELDENYYFFCMTPVSLQTQLVQVDAEGEIVQITNVGGSYPAAASNDNGSFLLLSYDNAARQSVVSVVNPTGSVSQSAGFSIGAGDAVEEPIINHFIRTGRQFPFQVGKTQGGQYFFNGFYNYTFSVVFTDLSSGQGVIQGQQDDGGISNLVQLNGSTFATARFNFGDNYFLPNVALNTSGISSSSDLGGFSLPELSPNAPVKIITSTIKETEVILYGSNTKSGQIGLYVYDKASGEFLGTRYLGFSNPYEITNMINTADGGIAICGTTYVTGRFPRICLYKLSAEELNKIF